MTKAKLPSFAASASISPSKNKPKNGCESRLTLSTALKMLSSFAISNRTASLFGILERNVFTAQGFISSPAVKTLRSSIPKSDAVRFEIANDDSILSAVDNVSLLSHPFFGLFLLGDIDADAANEGNFALVIQNRKFADERGPLLLALENGLYYFLWRLRFNDLQVSGLVIRGEFRRPNLIVCFAEPIPRSQH